MYCRSWTAARRRLNNYLAGQNNPIFSFLFTLLIIYIEKKHFITN